MNLKDYISVYQSPESFKVEQFQNIEWSRGLWQYPSGEASGKQDCQMSFNYDKKLVEKIIGSSKFVASHYAERHGFCITGGYLPRLNKYDIGERMELHQDHANSIFEDSSGIPIVSMVGLINDDYEGGELVFHLGEERYVPDAKAGDIIIFPSCFPWKHESTEVTKGTKYSWVTWAW